MTPSLAKMDCADVGLRSMDNLCDASLHDALREETPDLSNVGVCENRSWVLGSANIGRFLVKNPISMQVVLASRDVFKILKAIVLLVSVNVVRFESCRAWAYEREHDYSMRVRQAALAAVVSASVDDIPAGVPLRAKYSMGMSVSHAPVLAHFIQAAERWRRLFPHFTSIARPVLFG